MPLSQCRTAGGRTQLVVRGGLEAYALGTDTALHDLALDRADNGTGRTHRGAAAAADAGLVRVKAL